jgi:Raf kinase inhibitor-like YbhB/YbcL family protein
VKRRYYFIVILVVAALGLFGSFHETVSAEGGKAMQLMSLVFTEGGMIPTKYTCKGQDISPPLEWKDAPPGTKSFALICDDPDAPGATWVHWVVYNIPPNITKLTEDIRPDKEFINGMMQGNNDWPKIGYGGPCPPSGTHRYYFKLYALDAVLPLRPGIRKGALLQAMKGHILAEAQLMGTYKK